jgi:hypothetical protein
MYRKKIKFLNGGIVVLERKEPLNRTHNACYFFRFFISHGNPFSDESRFYHLKCEFWGFAHMLFKKIDPLKSSCGYQGTVKWLK